MGYKLPALNSVQQRALRIIKGTATFDERFVPEHKDLTMLIEALRSMGCTIVFVTGVWDLFHIGHAEYIWRGKEDAKKLYPDSDHVIMVVGVETDELTKLRKGPDRPIVPQEERLRVLAHLRSVDILALQYEADQLYRVVAHDIRVISQSTADLPDLSEIESQCAHIVNLPPQSETSTTARVRRLSIDGVAKALSKVEEAVKEARNGNKV